MKETLEKAADQLLEAAARLQELAAKVGDQKMTIDFQNMSAEDQEALAKMFNAWTQKNFDEKFQALDTHMENISTALEQVDPDMISSIQDFYENCPDSSSISEAVEAINNHDLSLLDKIDDLPDFEHDYDLEEIRDKANDAADAIENINMLIDERISEKIQGFEALTELMSYIKLDELLLIINDGLAARFAAKKAREESATGNGASH